MNLHSLVRGSTLKEAWYTFGQRQALLERIAMLVGIKRRIEPIQEDKLYRFENDYGVHAIKEEIDVADEHTWTATIVSFPRKSDNCWISLPSSTQTRLTDDMLQILCTEILAMPARQPLETGQQF